MKQSSYHTKIVTDRTLVSMPLDMDMSMCACKLILLHTRDHATNPDNPLSGIPPNIFPSRCIFIYVIIIIIFYG